MLRKFASKKQANITKGKGKKTEDTKKAKVFQQGVDGKNKENHGIEKGRKKKSTEKKKTE